MAARLRIGPRAMRQEPTRTSATRCAGTGAGKRAGARVLILAAASVGLLPGPVRAQQPLTADQAARIALQQNPTVLTAEQEVRAASGSLLSTRSQVLPSLSGFGSYNNTIRESFVFTPTGAVSEKEFWSGGGRLSQSIISFPAWGQIRAASGTRDAARERSRATRADIALAAYRQFYAVLRAQKLATVAGQSLQLTQDQLRRTQALFELGSVARGDVLKQQVQVSQAELDRIAAEQTVVVERVRLAGMLGYPAQQRIEIDTTLTEAEIPVDSVGVLRNALERRPELADFRARLRSAGASLGAAQGARYPSMNGSLNYTFTTAGFPQNFREVDRQARWSALFSLSVPIFDGLFTKGRIREARARQLQAQYALRQAEIDVVVDVEQALQAASQARERIRVASAGLAAAEEDLKLSQEKYNVGSATVIELIDAQVALTRARSEYVAALSDARVAEVQLRRASGERF